MSRRKSVLEVHGLVADRHMSPEHESLLLWVYNESPRLCCEVIKCSPGSLFLEERTLSKPIEQGGSVVGFVDLYCRVRVGNSVHAVVFEVRPTLTPLGVHLRELNFYRSLHHRHRGCGVQFVVVTRESTHAAILKEQGYLLKVAPTPDTKKL